jgi:hypothetical protein
MSGGFSTATTVELCETPAHKLDGPAAPLSPPEHPRLVNDGTTTRHPGRTLGTDSTGTAASHGNSSSNHDTISSLPAPTTVSHPAERWNQSQTNVYRVLAAFWSLLVMGMNDAAYGAIIPYLGSYYHLEYTLVSLIFLSPFVGYTLSALLNNTIHQKLGQRGVAVICSWCHIIAYIIACLHPPYPVLVVVYMLAGFGSGLGDAAWNACKSALDTACPIDSPAWYIYIYIYIHEC